MKKPREFLLELRTPVAITVFCVYLIRSRMISMSFPLIPEPSMRSADCHGFLPMYLPNTNFNDSPEVNLLLICCNYREPKQKQTATP